MQKTPEHGWHRLLPFVGFAGVATALAVGLDGALGGSALSAAALAMGIVLAMVLAVLALVLARGERESPRECAVRIVPDPRVSRAKHPRHPF